MHFWPFKDYLKKTKTKNKQVLHLKEKGVSGRWIKHPYHGHLVMLTEILTEKQQFHTKANDLIKD